jgi:hypothetical protein
MFSKSIMKHFKAFGRGFTEPHAKLDAIHHRQNETQS